MKLLIVGLIGIFSLSAYSASHITGEGRTFDVNSCEILIPDLGASNDYVKQQLIDKGYELTTMDSIFNLKTFNNGQSIKTINNEFLADLSNVKKAYLEYGDVNGMYFNETILRLNIVSHQYNPSNRLHWAINEADDTTLFYSKGYDSKIDSNDTDYFDAKSLPPCVQSH